MQKIRYEASDRWSFDFGFHYSETSEYSRYDRLIRVRDNGDPFSAEWNYGPQKWLMLNSQMTKTSSSSNLYDQMHASLAYQNFQESRISRAFESDIRETRSEQVDAISLNLDLDKALTPRTNLYYGVEYIFNAIGSMANEKNIENMTMMDVGSTKSAGTQTISCF